MGAHMKTTIDISDPLFEAAKSIARRRGTTLRALVELGLRHVLESQPQAAKPFKLRKASLKGNGLQPRVADLSWDQLRELSYGDNRR
jgi:Bacterial antitoxin of type II TA system, VapB